MDERRCHRDADEPGRGVCRGGGPFDVRGRSREAGLLRRARRGVWSSYRIDYRIDREALARLATVSEEVDGG